MPESLFISDTEAPVCPTRWPFLDKYTFENVVPKDPKLHEFLSKDWQALLTMCTPDDVAGIFRRFPPEADQVVNRQRTVYWELPIMIDVGTASYADVRKRVTHMNNHMDADKKLFHGDMQTMFRDSIYFSDFPEHFPNTVTAAGELHNRFHTQHADLRQNRMLIYSPLFMHFGVKTFASDKLQMKAFSDLERWTFIFMAGTLAWLRRAYTDEELTDIKSVLKQVRKNLPVYNQVGWLYYFGTFIWGNMKAVRVNDHQRLDFMWMYGLMMYAESGKYIYKKGCLLNLKVLMDSEPNVRRMLEDYRTYSEHGRPCSGGEMDMLRERVRCIVFTS